MNTDSRFNARWMKIAQAFWVFAAFVAFMLWLTGAYANFSVPIPSCVDSFCDPYALSFEDFNLMRLMGLPADLLLVFWNASGVFIGLFFFITAGLIFWRRSNDFFSLVSSFFLIFLGAVALTEFDDAVSRAYPALQPLMDLVFSAGWTSMVLVFFNFPDGRLVPNKIWVRGLIFVSIVLVSIPSNSLSRGLNNGFFAPLFVLILITGLWAQVHRFRLFSNPAQKQQTKWVILGLAGAVITMLIWIWMTIRHPANTATPERIYTLLWIRPLIFSLISFLPITIVFSILRYKLWDIDILIRRTLSYGLLTGILLAVYFSGVIIMQEMLSIFSGAVQSPLVTVVSTLAIAGLFNPLRVRVQDFIDRRFFRAKFDAERTLTQFAATARDEVDLGALSSAILGVVDETLQPERSSLWLKIANR